MHVAVVTVLSFLALVSVILRLWARRMQKQSWDLSDYLIIIGVVRHTSIAMGSQES